ncbi:hypothetical protein [Kitasatospora aureofaciens]|uniref:hypothetical protein n=1 Tax=Kitasatospora aureofaciens TaxID=1894 RepID=UPI0033CB4114
MARTATRRTAPAADHKPVLIALPKVDADPYAGPGGRRHYTCASCETSWAGGEADCWNCGRPASTPTSPPPSSSSCTAPPPTAPDHPTNQPARPAPQQAGPTRRRRSQ